MRARIEWHHLLTRKRESRFGFGPYKNVDRMDHVGSHDTMCDIATYRVARCRDRWYVEFRHHDKEDMRHLAIFSVAADKNELRKY